MLTPKEFAKRAGFPKKWKERHLQEYVIEQLRSRGFEVQDEVKIMGGKFRADIVTNWASSRTIIEMKKVISSDDIYKATRQLQIYGKHLQGQRRIIMGLLPDGDKAQSSVMNGVQESRADGIEVVFLNCEPQWCPPDTSRFRQFKTFLSNIYRIAGNLSGISLRDLRLMGERKGRELTRRYRWQVVAICLVFGLLWGFHGGQLLRHLSSQLDALFTSQIE